jgi:hypothetical protein
MPTTLTIHDRALDGTALHELTLEFLTERIDVHELIRSRVYQEVTEYNARRTARWAGLVQPEQAQRGTSPGTPPRRVDWEAQVDRALRAFKTGTLLVIIDGRQVAALDEEFEIGVETSVAFVRLLPLIGG